MAWSIGVSISHGFHFHFRLLAIFRSSSKFIKCVSRILIDSPIGAFFALFYSFDSIVEMLKMLHVADDDDVLMLMLHANSIWGFFFKNCLFEFLMEFKIHWLWNFVATLKPNSWSYHKLLFFLQRFYRKTSLDKQKLISPFDLSVSMWSVQQRRGGKGAKHDILQSVIWDFFVFCYFGKQYWCT